MALHLLHCNKGQVFLGIAFFFLIFTTEAYPQRITPAPLPPIHYTAWQDQGPTEAEAEADVGGEDEGELDFLDKSLGEISRTQVTSPTLSAEVETASRTAQPIARTAAAVYVVTNGMIRRCGARNIPEVLRTVPGVNVARINAGAWAISIRGFRGQYSNKLLIQIDGVAIYNPLHSGVYWDRYTVMLEDVDRIEVIRGPGGSIWSNNAVNGIINIVTKSSRNTKGIYLDVGGGNEHRQFSDARAGGQVGNLSWRVYGMNMDDDHGYVPPPDVAVDAYKLAQGGFRTEWTPTRCDTVTFQGDFCDTFLVRRGYVSPGDAVDPTRYKDTRMLTRWVREIDDDTDWAMQLYYLDAYGRDTIMRTIDTFDFDFQYHMRRGKHDFVCGFGYRNHNIEHGSGLYDTEQIPSYFFQDTITLVDERLYFTAGCKFDHNSVTDFEYQPTVKLAWTPNERTSIWGAISRNVRTPSLYDRFYDLWNMVSEDALTYEMGIRRQPTDKLYWECTAYFSRYNHLVGTWFWLFRRNVGDADNCGFEFNATYEINPRWHLNGSYSFFAPYNKFKTHYTPTYVVGGTPRNQAYFQSGWDLGNNVTFDLMFRYVDSLPAGVAAYFVSDMRLAWRPTKNLEMAVVGQNLLDGGHYEFVRSPGSSARPTEVEPGAYGMISWRY